MARVYVFGDEAGNFDFSNKAGASKYFILGTVTMPGPGLGDQLLSLRRELAWRGVGLESTFHASKDSYIVRNAVFAELRKAQFRFDCVVLEKRKASPDLAASPDDFYKTAWYLHFEYLAPRILTARDELLVTAASLGTRRRYKALRSAIDDVIRQSAWRHTVDYRVAFWPAESDPCLQVADYCAWALQRAFEMADGSYYELIRDKVASQIEPWKFARVDYY